MALLCTSLLEQRLKKYKQQAGNFCSLQQKRQWNSVFLKSILASLAPMAATAMLPNSVEAQCNPAFPKSFNLVSSSQNKLVEGGFDYNGYGNVPLDVNQDGNIDFVLNFSATSSGEDYMRELTILPYGDAHNGFIQEGELVANLKPGESVPGAGPFVNLEVAKAKTLYRAERVAGKETCEGFCEGEGNIGIVLNKSQYGFLNVSLDIKSAQEASITIKSGGVHPEKNKKIKAKCTALPYKLPFFQAKSEAEKVLLAWAAAVDENIYGLELQRSTDGAYFYKIDWKGQRDLKPNTKLIYEDEEVLKGQTYYYRIKKIRMDGTFVYSTIINATLGNQQQISSVIGKVETDSQLKVAKVHVSSPKEGKATIVILNTERVPVKTIASDLKIGDNELIIPTDELPTNTYFVKIEVDGKRSYRKLNLK